jgi:TNF receptor-associated factor 4
MWIFHLAKGKYVSLFICICRGDYDALLFWPFSHRVTFTLIDQCEDIDNRRNITYSVKPNICKENKPFLGRPITDRNASFGAQKFTDLDTMASLEYIKSDTLYIKVEIDNEEMIII